MVPFTYSNQIARLITSYLRDLNCDDYELITNMFNYSVEDFNMNDMVCLLCINTRREWEKSNEMNDTIDVYELGTIKCISVIKLV